MLLNQANSMGQNLQSWLQELDAYTLRSSVDSKYRVLELIFKNFIPDWP